MEIPEPNAISPHGATSESRSRVEMYALLSALIGMAALSAISLIWQTVDPEPVRFAGITIDRLSALLTLLVAAIGAVTLRFSIRYLDGNPLQRRFLWRLTYTIGAAYLLMCSTNLLLFFAAWALTSMGLHGLLTVYYHRPDAFPPARKKFLISRLGDVALIAAIVLIWRDSGTLDLYEFFAIVSTQGVPSLSAIGLLIAIAALTKSAQFPFHSWLPETMEAPTPVSALMHAGIINAGGALLLRFAPVIVRVPEVLLLLSVVGTLTFALGMLAMWAQAKIKRILAWSTVSQMGFMMVQCGLAAFPAAALHIVGHGCYKAWKFLRSGELPSPSEAPASPKRALILAAVGTGFGVLSMFLAAWLTGFSPLHSPGELALSAILAIAVGQLWVAVLKHPSRTTFNRTIQFVSAVVSTVALTVAAFTLYQGATMFLTPVLGELTAPSGVIAWLAAVIPVAALIALLVAYAFSPVFECSPAGRAFQIHALHGFYLGTVADRFVEALWPRPTPAFTGAKNA